MGYDMKKNKIAALLIIFSCLFMGYGSIVFNRGHNLGGNTSFVESRENNAISVVNPQSSSSSVQAVEQKGRKLTATEMAVKSDWLRRTGRAPDDLEAYEHYTDEQLMELVNQGDVNAMHVIGIRKLITDGIEVAMPFAQKEIVYGSLRGISTAANYLEPSMSSNLPIEELKKQLMESTAYYRLYAMRGDKYSSRLFEETQVKMFQKYYKIEKVFNAEDEAWLNSRARELYDFYQSERNKLGLGDFDNEVPKEVKDFFGE